jgi:hypothetical protein
MAIDGQIAQYQENAGVVNHARGLRRLIEKEIAGFDVRAVGGLATSGINNGSVARWLPASGGALKGDLAVTQRGAGANMSVDVSQGGCTVGGTASTTQGNYFVYNDATSNVAIAAADPTNPRIDVVGVRIRDTEYGESTTDCQIVVVTGTPAGSPAVPALPAEFLTLAHVAVAAATPTIVNANITDKRAASGGSVVLCTSGSRPTIQLFPGMLIYETDTNKLQQYTTSTTLWTPPWNLPWGQQAAAVDTTVQTGITTVADLTSLTTGSVTVVANRRLRTTVGIVVQQVSSNGTFNVYIADGSGTQLQTQGYSLLAANFGSVTFDYLESSSAGALTRKARASTSAGTLSTTVSATQYGYIVLTDIGPSAAPA